MRKHAWWACNDKASAAFATSHRCSHLPMILWFSTQLQVNHTHPAVVSNPALMESELAGLGEALRAAAAAAGETHILCVWRVCSVMGRGCDGHAAGGGGQGLRAAHPHPLCWLPHFHSLFPRPQACPPPPPCWCSTTTAWPTPRPTLRPSWPGPGPAPPRASPPSATPCATSGSGCRPRPSSR